MRPFESFRMPDIQSYADDRNLPIDGVGVRGVCYPVGGARDAVRVPVTSLCPCSKEISAYGAHNQRSLITVRAELRGEMSIEELIVIAEVRDVALILADEPRIGAFAIESENFESIHNHSAFAYIERSAERTSAWRREANRTFRGADNATA